ncbi:MAG: sulfatase-like hydrolase/transferase [Firmicutes bacterium]|nr:sulfatase-like hydrolase/transferase [Bacillota bacterium]
MEDRSLIYRFFHSSVVILAIASIVVDYIVEALSRHDPIGAALFMGQHPLVALCNCMLIIAVLSLSMLFRRRAFAMCMFALIWVALGITNCVILTNRMTPFNVKDLSNLKEGTQILRNYFSVTNLILIGAIIALLAVIVIVLFRKLPKRKQKTNYRNSLIGIVLIVALSFGVLQGGMKTGVLDTFFGSLPLAYQENGTPYSFLITWVKTGIDKPSGYSEESVEKIFSGGEMGEDGIYTPGKDDDRTAEQTPNIIYLQLESFIDPLQVKGFEYSEDPMPNFRELMSEYSSGYITVPAVGAGTANVEFEAITGISARFFGPGEYPHKSVLTEKTCESAAYDMKQLGYTSHAIHNHRGAFYNRNIVFKNLGFDTFTSLEYMNNVVKTPKNWAKDGVLTDNIMDALKSTKGKDYIYTISVQGHGKYPTEPVLEDPKIEVTKAPTEEMKWAYEYYANQVFEMDQFVRELTDTLAAFDEDVVLVMYGDHLPALNMTADMMESGDLYKTQYIIWDNFGMKREEKNLDAYYIHAEVTKRLGIHAGMLTRYHQNYSGKKSYMRNFKALAYDMLYGRQYIYGEKNPYEATDMQMGVKKIKIDKIVQIGDRYYIKGQNFTEYSRISLNGEVLKTVYLGPTILALSEDVDPEKASEMKVSQVEKNKEVLSTTE